MIDASFDSMWSAIEPVGRVSSGGYRRFAWTGADHTMREWFAGETARRGLDLTEDRAGNQWAWWGSPDEDGPGLVLGSHLDSVPDGGAFDGPLGVVTAFAALDALRAARTEPARPVAVVNFGDEEGARFGVSCTGSRLLTGLLPADAGLALADDDGVTLAEAMRASGRNPEAVGRDEETLRRIGAFVELHVEQGRGLAYLDRAVAVGSLIRPHGRWRIDLTGRADHAGTTPLADRHDAVVAYASVVLAARAAAERHGGLATCGKVIVSPNGVNAIPSSVTAWLDARASDPDAVRAIVADVTRAAAEVGGTVTEESWTGATPFDPDLTARLARLLDDAPVLEAGAGHDAGILATAGIPTAMVFVRNPTGVSHSPEEFAGRHDCLAGVDALTTVIGELAGFAAGSTAG